MGMSIFDMVLWVIAITVVVYLIIGVYHLVKLIRYYIFEYMEEAEIVKQTHVKVGVWMVIGLTVLSILSTLVSPFF